ncbi:MAG: hypothetical protein L0219_00940, partial [Phycisphaerales bacterium]|nr:hypothetical protein [Phycisphaerales bacterium]
MDICALPEADKRSLARKVGSGLVKEHGKKRHYTVQEVKAAARRQNFPEAWDCWALSLYASPSDFAEYHERTGEDCDYSSMHERMVEAVSTDAVLPDVVRHVTPSTESSWFADLL